MRDRVRVKTVLYLSAWTAGGVAVAAMFIGTLQWVLAQATAPAQPAPAKA